MGEDEDDLGCYADGVKRTLTDEQIAIFRHSEIQSLLREKRHEEERRLAELDETARSKGDLTRRDLDQVQTSATVPSFEELDGSEEDGEIEGMEEFEDDDDEEYARFLEAERRQFRTEATSNRKNKRAEAMKGPGRTTSTRRRVRELDTAMGGNDVLDYGDGPTVSSKVGDPAPMNEQVNGRKIWWPAIKA